MFNVTILKLKDIVKYIVCLFILILAVVVISKSFSKIKEDTKEVTQNIENTANSIASNSLLACLDTSIPVVSSINKEYKEVAKEDETRENKDILQEMLQTQISSLKTIEEAQEEGKIANTDENSNNQNQDSKKTESTNTEVSEAGVKTEVITNNPITESFNKQYGKVKIKNQTDYELTDDILNPDTITFDNKNIMIFHTHSCESYTPSEAYQYTQTGNFRTTDLNYTVTRVGIELTEQLKQYGYNVVHDTSYNDYPSYNGSYTRSLQTVQNMLQTTPSDIIIDLHRDAIGSRSDYAPIVKIGDNDVAAQIMFVIGTNDGGLWHPNWSQNLKFAVKIQQKAEEMYPGLFKPIMLTSSRYNQHTGKYANIIEVGATGNTMEQCLTSMKYLAKVMKEVIG